MSQRDGGTVAAKRRSVERANAAPKIATTRRERSPSRIQAAPKSAAATTTSGAVSSPIASDTPPSAPAATAAPGRLSTMARIVAKAMSSVSSICIP